MSDRADTLAALVSAAAIQRAGIKSSDLVLVIRQLIKDNHPATKLGDAPAAAAIEKLLR